MTRFSAHIAEQIWDMKYRFKEANGTPIDETVEDSWTRIAKALSLAESPEYMDKNRPWTYQEEYEKSFYKALEDFKYLPAGRITSGAGTSRDVTLFNCFVMGTIPDSMGGIFDMLKEAALTMQQGGGIGYDFSTLRPKGALVEGVASDASGPLSFMDVWDAMCRTIMSAGSRRGAMMATIRCDHPDVFDFITAKKDQARLRMFNMSVLITDPFMEALENNEDWDLKFTDKHGVTKVYQTVKAVDLWNAIMDATYHYAEPGIIFIDRINKANNLHYCEDIAATNPCGEQPLPPYGACLLGSVNMAQMIDLPFTASPRLNEKKVEETVRAAVRMMDNVVDVSKFPLPEQKAEAKAKRRIGLGVTGLADALIMCGIRYGSIAAQATANKWMHFITRIAYLESIELAKEKGPFPSLNIDEYLKSDFMKNMDEDIRNAIKIHGIRNALLTSIAPTGTISLYAGNVSSGIEPVFAHAYDRKILQKDGTKTVETVEDYALYRYRNYCLDNGMDYDVDNLPDYFVTAQELTPTDHILMQAAVQEWIDSSISKTVNLPEDISFEAFKDVYIEAWANGCKGCTTYRPNDVTGSVLSVTQEKKEEPEIQVTNLGRPFKLQGNTYKIKWADSDHAIYINLTYSEDENGNKYPFEIFINSKNMDHFVWTVALTRMVSAVFRASNDSRFVVEELKAVFDPKGGQWDKGKYVPSVIAAIGNIIETFMRDIGYMDSDNVIDHVSTDPEPTAVTKPLRLCSSCSSTNVQFKEGCFTCGDCGNSKCG